MSRVLITGLFLVLNAMSAAGQWRPRIEASAPGWDFGVRNQGGKDTHSIALKNVGKAELVIKKVSTTCGCVQPSLPENTRIAAGESATLMLELDTNRGEGEIKKFVIVESNDPIQPKLMLEMTGTIHPAWCFDGHTLHFGPVPNGQPTSKTMRLRVRADCEVAIKQILAHPEDRLKVTPKPYRLENGEHGWDLEVALVGKMEAGYFEGVVFVTTDYEERSSRGFRVGAEITSSSQVTPQRLAFGILEPGATKTIALELRKAHGDGLRVADVVCKDERITSKVTPIEDGVAYRIDVTLTAREGDEDLRGQIEIGIDEPGWVVHKIDYYAKVSGVR
ncbi:MAG: DUF1573 domain-containing protein [Planctomycetes bacterium]|nr:DUF1573 domain-containing protein [Planctomycetota bacterium]